MAPRLAEIILVSFLLTGAAACRRGGDPEREKESNVAVAEAGGAAFRDDDPKAIHPDVPGVVPVDLFERRTPREGLLETFTMSPHVDIAPEAFLRNYAARLWGLGKRDSFRQTTGIKSVNEYVVLHYSQHHAGLQVSQTGISLTTHQGRVVSGLAHLAGGLRVDPRPSVSEAAARKAAIERLAAHLHTQVDDVRLEGDAVGKLVVRARERRLAWSFLVAGQGKDYGDARQTFIDAADGKILEDYSIVLH